MRKQCCHTKLGCRREHGLHRRNLCRSLGFSKQLVRQIHSYFITKCIRNDDINSARRSKRLYIVSIKICLLRNSGESRTLGKFIANKGCPLFSERGQIPVLVELFNVISNVLIKIFKNRAGFLETLAKGRVELAIEMVHLAVVASVFLPKLSILSDMETSDISLIELLHLCHLKQAIVIIANTLVPFQSSAFFNSNNHIICFDDIVGDLRHISSENTFIDARETLTVKKLLHIKAVKSLH